MSGRQARERRAHLKRRWKWRKRAGRVQLTPRRLRRSVHRALAKQRRQG